MTEIERLREALTPRQAELLAQLQEHKIDHPGSWYLFVNGGFKLDDARALYDAGLVDYSEQMGMPALRLRVVPEERLREALLPCPFCGGAASFEAAEAHWTVGCNETNEDSEGGAFEILCYGYQSLTTFATKREAAAAWNRRAALAATPPGADNVVSLSKTPTASQNNMLIARIKGMPASAATTESEADPCDPNAPPGAERGEWKGIDLSELSLKTLIRLTAYDEGGYGDNRSRDFENEDEAIAYARSLEASFHATVWKTVTVAMKPVRTQLWPLPAPPSPPSSEGEK